MWFSVGCRTLHIFMREAQARVQVSERSGFRAPSVLIGGECSYSRGENCLRNC